MTQTPSESVFEPILLESEDAVLKAADEIRLKRLNRARWSSFQEKKEVMIRWDNPGNSFGESYTSVTPALQFPPRKSWYHNVLSRPEVR